MGVFNKLIYLVFYFVMLLYDLEFLIGNSVYLFKLYRILLSFKRYDCSLHFVVVVVFVIVFLLLDVGKHSVPSW